VTEQRGWLRFDAAPGDQYLSVRRALVASPRLDSSRRAPNMTTRIDFSKEQERGGAAENQKRLASRTEKARRSGLDACFYRRAIVVCRNFLRARQDVGDLWRLTHRHVYALQPTSTLFRVLVASNALAIQTQ